MRMRSVIDLPKGMRLSQNFGSTDKYYSLSITFNTVNIVFFFDLSIKIACRPAVAIFIGALRPLLSVDRGLAFWHG